MDCRVKPGNDEVYSHAGSPVLLEAPGAPFVFSSQTKRGEWRAGRRCL
jgi:hypothetical protein